MYCPNCAALIDNVKFCRSCGANVSLVPQALTGKISELEGEQTSKRGRHRSQHRSEATLENSIKSFFIGIAFLIIAGAVWRFAPAGGIWWFWMLIPAFAMIGEGIAKYIRWRNEQEMEAVSPTLPSQEPAQQLSAPDTSSLEDPPQPSSVVEHTTYHLK
jgi:hypothetical protein